MPVYKNGEIIAKRPLVKRAPKILLKSAESILSMEFQFSCLNGDCTPCLAKQKEKSPLDRCVHARTLKFHDSVQVLTAPLSGLVEDLATTARATQTPLHRAFAHTHAFAVSLGLKPEEADRFVTAKLNMPWQEFTSASNLQNVKAIPKREVFVSELSNTNTTIDEDAYKDFVWTWKIFKCNNLLDLANIYVATDASQLVDIMLFHFARIMELTNLWAGYFVTSR